MRPGPAHVMAEDEAELSCSLTLPEVNKDDAGSYKCIAQNVAGEAKCVARINVTGQLLLVL